MNKPPLVNTKTLTNNVSLQIIAGKIAEAQRDADLAYYQPLLKQAQEQIDYISVQQEGLNTKLNDIDLAIQQARQETASELMQTIEVMYPELRQAYWSRKDWQSLKDRAQERKQ